MVLKFRPMETDATGLAKRLGPGEEGTGTPERNERARAEKKAWEERQRLLLLIRLLLRLCLLLLAVC